MACSAPSLHARCPESQRAWKRGEGPSEPTGPAAPPPHAQRSTLCSLRSGPRRGPRLKAARCDFDVTFIHVSAQGQPCQLCLRKCNSSRFLEYHNEQGAPRPCPRTQQHPLPPDPANFTLHVTASTGRRSCEWPRSPQSQARSSRDPGVSALAPASHAKALVFAAKEESQESPFSASGTLLCTQPPPRRVLTEATTLEGMPPPWVLPDKAEPFIALHIKPHSSSGREGYTPARSWDPRAEHRNSIVHQESPFLGNAHPNFHHRR